MTPAEIQSRLRALFERRDLKQRELDAIDAKISAETRRLAAAEGHKFMRVETARAIVFMHDWKVQ